MKKYNEYKQAWQALNACRTRERAANYLQAETNELYQVLYGIDGLTDVKRERIGVKVNNLMGLLQLILESFGLVNSARIKEE